MQLPVDLSIIVLTGTELANSDKATGHSKAAVNFPADKRGKRKEGQISAKCHHQVLLVSSYC